MKHVSQLLEDLRAIQEGWRESMSERDRAFDDLAAAQRGRPERAMNVIQKVAGGGVYSYAVEHGGDLTHRMSEFTTSASRGYEYVKPKVLRLYDTLHHPYGFAKEHGENMAANAKYYNKSLGAHLSDVAEAGEAYANEHSKLKVYNDMQHHAQQFAVSLGRRDFAAARKHIAILKSHIQKGEKHWTDVANEYDPNYKGPK